MAHRKNTKEKDEAEGTDVFDDWEDELSDDNLRELAGDAVFERGLAYFAKSKATLARDGGSSATFKVKGTRTYSTELYFEDLGLHVDCNCPHASEGAFCKHMVAAALVWRQHLGGDLPETSVDSAQTATKSVASAKRQNTIQTKQQALRAFVFGQSAAVLAEKLWGLAQTDRDSMAELRAWQAQVEAVNKPDGWKAAITELLRSTRSFYDWNESHLYTQRADKVLALLDALIEQSGEQAIAASMFALRKIYKVAEHADDSSGEIGDLMYAVQERLLDALKKAPPPAKWLDDWFSLMQEDPWGLWSEQAVLEVAGDAVRLRYTERVAKDWAAYQAAQIQTKPVTTGKPNASFVRPSHFDFQRSKLRKRYLDDLKLHGDSSEVLEALRTSVQDAHEHCELVQYCESIGKTREALQFALAAYKLHPTDTRTEDDLLRCYARDGWDAEVLAIHRQRLERHPRVENFVATLDAAVAAGHPKAAYRTQLYDWAAAREVPTVKPKAPWFRPLASDEGRDVSMRVQWLLFEKRVDEALALVQPPHSCGLSLLQDIAKLVRATSPDQALALLQRVFDKSMPFASTPYKEVLALVKSIAPLMQLQDRQEWIAQLRTQYRAKRNFISGLDALKLK